MENPMVKQMIFYAFGLFYMICLMAAGMALIYYSVN